MMLPNLDTFVLLTNEGPSMDKKHEYWSIIKHGDEGVLKGDKNGVSSGDFATMDTTRTTTNFSIFDQEMKSIQSSIIVLYQELFHVTLAQEKKETKSPRPGLRFGL